MRRVFALIAVLHLAVAGSAVAQQSSPQSDPTRVWLTAGLGISTEEGAGLVSVEGLFGRRLFSLRLGLASGIFGNSFWDVGLLYGRATRSRLGMTSLSAGLAVVGGERCEGLGGCTPTRRTIGVPLDARADWHALPFLGFGIHLFANANPEQSFVGVVVGINLGSLR